MTRTKWIATLLGALALVAALVWAFRPDPVPVDVAEVIRAPMQVTVSAEGISRVRDTYLVTAPIAGVAERSPVAVGDAVQRGETVVARITPADPQLLDVRARAEAEAAAREARAAVAVAEAALARAEVDLRHARSNYARSRELAARGAIPQRMLEDSQQVVETAQAGVEAAESELAMREAMLARAEAALMGPAVALEIARDGCCAELRAPQSGQVLWLEDESARLVQAGEVLMGIGDLADLEIEVDLLSGDAVRIAQGAPARIERWGGEGALEARVRRIDPRGFTRVSALGIEEQRVRVRLDLLTPPEARAGLGDAFRVFARIVEWETDAALQVPIGALIRDDGAWAVFRIDNGTARLTRVEIGRRTQDSAEVTSGLSEGDQVVAFPGDRVSNATRVAPRTVP
ncbi:MAG: efflux RND transporter periplasmic adaptor subunit [Alkalilacustris sp.]